MNVLSHERARRLLHTPAEDLPVARQADLADHLAGCLECQAYADELRALQRTLARAMHTRWDSLRPSATSSHAVQRRWRQVQVKRQSARLIALLAGIGSVVLLILYGPTLLASILQLLNINPVTPVATPVVTPVVTPAVTPVATELSTPQFVLAFTSADSSSSGIDINMINSNGEGRINLTAPYDISDGALPVWSPDGSRVAFLDCQETSDPDKSNILYVISRDGTNLISMERLLSSTRVAPQCSVNSISWSPDSKRIAFEGWSLDYPYYSDIFIVSADGNQLENFTEDLWSSNEGQEGISESSPEWSSEHFPTWSPNGKTLAMVVNGEIYLVSDDGTNLRKLTGRNGDAISLNWTPDGKHIVYGDGAYSEILSVSVENGAIKSLPEVSEKDEYDPDLSPDGTLIAYYSGSGGIYVMDINGQNVTQIASSGVLPSWSPDGEFIAYKKPISEGEQITWFISVVSKDGSWDTQLAETVGETPEISWSYYFGGIQTTTVSQDSAATPETLIQPTKVTQEFTPTEFMLAFVSSESTDPFKDQALNIINSNGEGLKNLTARHNIHHPLNPVWSPDGSRIAFIDCQDLQDNPDNMLYVISRDGTNLISMERILSPMNVELPCSDISWSPDSKKIAFYAFGGDVLSDIFIVSADGDSIENLTGELHYENVVGCQGLQNALLKACVQERVFEQSPVWSPDGNTLAVVIDDEIYIVSVDGNHYRKLTDQEGTPYAMDWTQDSKHIVYSNYDGDGQIYSVSVDSGDIQRIGEGKEPDLSPDGTQISFSREDGIYVMDISGQNLEHIVSSYSWAPRWSPDSNIIVYLKGKIGKQGISFVSKDGSWEKELFEGVIWNNNISLSK